MATCVSVHQVLGGATASGLKSEVHSWYILQGPLVGLHVFWGSTQCCSEVQRGGYMEGLKKQDGQE